MNTEIIDLLVNKVKNDNFELSDILSYLFKDEGLKHKYVSEIRRSTVIWHIANEVLIKSQIDKHCKIMAIWDIKYFWKYDEHWKTIIENSIKQINVPDLVWYDLTWQWSYDLRKKLFEYMDNYYDLSVFNKDKIIDSILPTYWWTDWFVSIIDSIKILYPNKKINFIYPEASFLANVSIVKSILWEQSLIKVNKAANDNFFFNLNQINTLYSNDLQKNNINIFYITPVWNPTWTKLNDNNFYEIIKQINLLDPNAIFIFDSVYVWLLKKESSTNMFKKVFEESNIVNRIIFTESLSKTLWTTWIRVWWIWTLNNILFNELSTNIILKKSWFSKFLNEFVISLLNNKKEVFNFQNSIYDFWDKQRHNFLKFIKKNYSKYYELNLSPKICDKEWIYVLLKINNNYSVTEIFSQTWIIWVWIELSDWLYIRYAFWNVNYY